MRFLIPPKAKPTAGFTLIELLVVILIMGILAAIAAPGWLGFMNRQRVGAVRSDIVQTLRTAQQQAQQRRAVVTVEAANVDGQPVLRVNGAAQPLGGGGIQVATFSFNPADGTKNTTATTLSFDYQGLPIGGNLPFVFDITAPGNTSRQCVRVETLLGSIKTLSGATCDAFSP
ncbi:GspH/FimT family pseudopilin [Phormidium sp. FACHB-1136]|uniref:pilus assembly FimT family protein n=1 Tax=Phormidium sp. FACHB-1136 TaxID=2692848 RepID=UPI001689A187|nr:GspH/FimT family pseudopilin [Phormidium sp. FACHB-1136]MBD2428805.1 GspH/FimT family pseudopilin [Phormidium sp. FACHB-1136]